jgi:hypothetical protein
MQTNILNKAILVNLKITIPGNVRQDKTLTDEVIKDKQMENGAGKWVKQRFPDSLLSPFTKLSAEARIAHYKNSLSWTDDGFRILPILNHFDYMGTMGKYKQKFEELIDSHFCKEYDAAVTWAMEKHGPRFEPSHYLGCEFERRKFSFVVSPTPIPSGSDFRINFNKEELEEMQKSVENRVNEATKEANKDLWKRLSIPIKHMIEKLSDAEAQFKDSLVGNIKDMVSLIPNLNVTDDPDLEAIREDIANSIIRVPADTLRENKVIRKATADAAQELYKRMEGYFQ